MAFDELVVSFFVDEVVGGFFVNVPPGHVAAIYDLGRGVLPKVKKPGLHLKIPFWQKAKLFNAQILEYTIHKGFKPKNKEALGDEAIRAVTADNKHIEVEGSILFRVDKTKVNEIWENIGEDFVSKIVRPVSRSRIRAVLSEVTTQDLISRRTEVERKIQEELNKFFNPKGLICEGFLLSEVKDLGKLETARDDKVLFKREEEELRSKDKA